MSRPPRGSLLCGAPDRIGDTLRTFLSKMCTGFTSETTMKYTLCPNQLPPSWTFQQCVFIAPSPVWHQHYASPQDSAAHPPTSHQPPATTHHMLSRGLRVAENGLDIIDAYVSSCVHFLSQPSLHLAVLLSKNAVSCGLLTSILSGLHLAPDQQAVCISFLHQYWWVSAPSLCVSFPLLGGHGRQNPSLFR